MMVDSAVSLIINSSNDSDFGNTVTSGQQAAPDSTTNYANLVQVDENMNVEDVEEPATDQNQCLNQKVCLLVSLYILCYINIAYLT